MVVQFELRPNVTEASSGAAACILLEQGSCITSDAVSATAFH